MLINPNLSQEELSDDVIIQDFVNPNKKGKVNLYSIMAKRADNNSEIKNHLFRTILETQLRNEFFGGIIHAWLPVLFILQNSNEQVKTELKDVLKQWNKDEKELFLNYIKKVDEYRSLLHDILA